MLQSQFVRTSMLAVCLMLAVMAAPSAQPGGAPGSPASSFSVPVVYRKLPNGLRVVVSENHAAPVVVVEG